MLSKNKQLLGKKTKRANFSKGELNKEKIFTTIKLINLCDKRNKAKCYTYIKFSFTDRIYLDSLIKYKNQSIELDIESDKIFIIDKIELGNDIGNKVDFLIPIYINRTNTCYIDLKAKKKGYSFEFIFYAKTIKKLPEYFQYNDELQLREFDTYNLKYRKKLIILNVEDKVVNDYIQKVTFDSNSYKICVRINNKGNAFPSIHELKLEKKIRIRISSQKANTQHIIDILNLFEELKENKSLKSLITKYKYLYDDNALHQFIKHYDYIETSYLDIPNIDDNDVNLIKEYLLKLIVKYLFIKISKNKKPAQIKKINNNIMKMINNITNIINDIEQFTKDLENSNILKFRLFRATLYNLYSAISGNSSNKEVCIEILSKYTQKIIDIRTCSRDDPYYNAVEFLKDVANNINEDSALFDVLMQYNSGISDDINLFNKEKKYCENDTKYEISMITVSDIAEHLKNILPEFIVRYTLDNEVDSFYSTLNDLIFINEKKSLKLDEISDLDELTEYTLPIVILLLHECWGHRKVAISNKIVKDSPIRNYLRSENFDEELIKVIKENTGKIKGESGLELEYLLTGDNKSRIFPEFLLNYRYWQNENLLDVKLWVKSNFTDFQKLMIQNYREINKDHMNKIQNKNRESKKDNDLSVYNEKVYYIDGIKIGPFCKV